MLPQGKLAQYAATLGLTGRITFEEVKAAYRRKIREWHPDFHHGKASAAEAHAKTLALNEAYEFLSEITEEQVIPSVADPSAHSHNQYRTRHTYQKQPFAPGFPDPVVVEVFLKSSSLVSAGYDASQRLLYLKFQGGGVYRYFNVPSSVFEELLAAESHGRYANRRICHRFRYERCAGW